MKTLQTTVKQIINPTYLYIQAYLNTGLEGFVPEAVIFAPYADFASALANFKFFFSFFQKSTKLLNLP